MCFEGMILKESGQPQRKWLDEQRQQVVERDSPQAKDMADRNFPAKDRDSVGTCFAALLILLAVCVPGSPVILRLRDLRSMMIGPRQN